MWFFKSDAYTLLMITGLICVAWGKKGDYYFALQVLISVLGAMYFVEYVVRKFKD